MPTKTLVDLGRAIRECDQNRAISLTKEAVREEIDPLEVFAAMAGAMKEVGNAFEKGILWLPELVGAAEAMRAAVPIIEELVAKAGANTPQKGSIVVGTVFGDIHSIGKTMVCTLLAAEGFEVHDLGINISSESFLEAVRKYNADILAMSALLTTTATEQRKVIDLLRKEGLRNRVKVIVGGGAITQEYASAIGADGYDPTAPGAVKLARKLLDV